MTREQARKVRLRPYRQPAGRRGCQLIHCAPCPADKPHFLGRPAVQPSPVQRRATSDAKPSQPAICPLGEPPQLRPLRPPSPSLPPWLVSKLTVPLGTILLMALVCGKFGSLQQESKQERSRGEAGRGQRRRREAALLLPTHLPLLDRPCQSTVFAALSRKLSAIPVLLRTASSCCSSAARHHAIPISHACLLNLPRPVCGCSSMPAWFADHSFPQPWPQILIQAIGALVHATSAAAFFPIRHPSDPPPTHISPTPGFLPLSGLLPLSLPTCSCRFFARGRGTMAGPHQTLALARNAPASRPHPGVEQPPPLLAPVGLCLSDCPPLGLLAARGLRPCCNSACPTNTSADLASDGQRRLPCVPHWLLPVALCLASRLVRTASRPLECRTERRRILSLLDTCRTTGHLEWHSNATRPPLTVAHVLDSALPRLQNDTKPHWLRPLFPSSSHFPLVPPSPCFVPRPIFVLPPHHSPCSITP